MKDEEQKASIIEVAKRAGVSIATASRVISKSAYPVTEKTREKVLKAAAELDYQPNTLARGFRSQRSQLLAVVVGDNVDPYFAEITRGVEEVANTHGYLTIVCNTDRNPRKELHYLQSLQDYRVDSVIFAGGGLSDAEHARKLEQVIQHMRKRGAAIVALAQHTLRVPAITTDNYGGASAMTEHLLKLGHQRIAFITGPSHLLVANLRLQGYMAAMIKAGFTIDPQFLLAGDFSRSGGERAAQSILQMRPQDRPSAVFAANDEMAIGLTLELRKAGVRIPEEISLCGFGDILLSQMITPALTTVHIDLRQLGRLGAERAFTLLDGGDVAAQETLLTRIIERETTGPWKAR